MAFKDFNYIALKRMTVDGEVRQPGDLVPEAAGWKDVAGKIRAGLISPVQVKEVDPAPEVPASVRRRKTAVKPTTKAVISDDVDVQRKSE